MNERERRIESAVNQAIEVGACPGAVCAIVSGYRGLEFEGAWGMADPEKQRAMSLDTAFDAASITKPVATATSVCILLERGAFHLGESLTRWFDDAPQFIDVTLRHLITHTSGLPAWKRYCDTAKNSKEVMKQVAKTALERRSGVGYTYSDIGYMLLAAVVEKVDGRPIDRFANDEIYDTLGMKETGYTPKFEEERYAVTGHCSLREGQTLRGEVHDPNAWVMGGVAGHAGLFTTCRDLQKYARFLLRGESGLLSFVTIREMSTNQNESGLPAHTLGWFAHPNGFLPRGDLLSRAAFGHSGFTGTALVFDPQIDRAFILLTNRVFCDPENALFLTHRKRILNAMAAAI